jgi:hypothetical protein
VILIKTVGTQSWRDSRSGDLALELTGRTRGHVQPLRATGLLVHREVAQPFARLVAAAARAGIDLAPASAFRDFATQVRIWNEKWRGERPILDRRGRSLTARQLSPARRVAVILHWSAAPGASRHHWGTDLDVFDLAALPRGYRLQLVPEEYGPGGPFARLDAWLAQHAATHGFYRPYAVDRGGVMPEPWHLSHAPTAQAYSRRLREATLRAAIEAGEIDGKAALLKALPMLYRRFVRNVESPPRRALNRGARAPSGGRASASARSAAGRARK